MTTAAPPASEALPAKLARGVSTNRWLVLVLVCLAQFMVILDATIVNVALPSIQSDLHFSAGNLQWVVNGYTLLFGGFLLLGGRAGDLFGRKRLFLLGVGVFTTASLLNGLATTQGQLIAFRALQGLGAALVSPAALSIITTTFSEGAERTKALAVWGAIAGGGSAFGLLLGGILTDALSWEWIFFVNVPIGIAAFLLSLRFVPESKAPGTRGGFDLAGAITVTLGLVALVYAIVKAQGAGWTSTTTLGFGALAVALLGTFVFIESRHKAPLVRLSIFRVRTLAVADGAMLVVGGGLFATFFFASIYLQEVLHYSPLKTGFAFLPMTAGIIIGSVVAQYSIRKIGIRPVIIGGMTTAAVGLALFTRTTVQGDYLTEVLPALVCIAFGMGNTFVPLTLIATTNIGERDAGLASGLFNTAQQVGGALGLAVLSTLAANKTSSLLADAGPVSSHSAVVHAQALLDGYHVAFWIGAALVLAGAVLIATLVRQKDIAHIDESDMAAAMAPA